MGVEQQDHADSIPKLRAISSGKSSKSSAMRTLPFHWPPCAASLRGRDQTDRRLRRDDDLFAFEGPLHQSRELRLGFVDIGDFHDLLA